jgi:DNA ligase-1
MIKGLSRYAANGVMSRLNYIGDCELIGKSNNSEKQAIVDFFKCTYEEMCKRVYMKAWDLIPLEHYLKRRYEAPREQRLKDLESACLGNDTIQVINYIKTNSIDECFEFFTKQLSNDLEGLIIKTTDGIWKDGKPTWQVKMKLEITSDLKVIGFNQGTKGSKYEGSLGSLICVSEDGKLRTDVGGLKDTERLKIWHNQEEYLNRIIEVKCNGVSKAKDKDCYAMLHPRFLKWRDDKGDANTLEEILTIESQKKGINKK